MFAIRVDLLTARYVATAYNNRDEAEWPPHPARLFSALVATWADGEPGTPSGDAELAALQWLEALPPPTILASETPATRTVVPVFVPVNDIGVIRAPDRGKLDAAERLLAEAAGPSAREKAAKQVADLRDKLRKETGRAIAVPAKFGKDDADTAERSLVDRRARQPRTFPSVAPDPPVFAFAWHDVELPPALAPALAALAGRLVRVGHSSSLVHARVVTTPMPDLATTVTMFAPDDERGDLMIRWVGPEHTRRLIRAHQRHLEIEPRVMPARSVRYRRGNRGATAERTRSVFDEHWIVFARIAGPRLPITSAAGLARQVRRALMSLADQPVAEILSGHRGDSSPSERLHAAVVPLPFVTGPYPDGRLLGVALVLPREADRAERESVMRAVDRFARPDGDARIARLELGPAPLVLRRVLWDDDGATLRSKTWTRPSTRWASVTPVALDRNPGDLHAKDPAVRARAFEEARRSVGEAITRLALPPPIELDVVRSCVVPGTAKPRNYPRFPSDARKPQRVLVHVRIGFAEPVPGPLLLGAGRYHGMGLCLPVDAARGGDS